MSLSKGHARGPLGVSPPLPDSACCGVARERCAALTPSMLPWTMGWQDYIPWDTHVVGGRWLSRYHVKDR
jgi:hypothetical protein